ncbi:Activating signal cointegrator 1 complex subunit 2-like protein [Drosera capensis]
MSNRSGNYRHHETSRGGYHQTQKKFVPKARNSASLRGSDSSSSAATAPNTGGAVVVVSSSSSSGGSGRRVRLAGEGEWVPNSQAGGSFVDYLPQDEAVAAGLGVEEGGLDPVETQRVVDLLNRELSRLLRLSPRDFWREVASDPSLHGFLDSFLQFRRRWYDFHYHGAKGIVAGVIVGDIELSRHVFMLLYRISSNWDPGTSTAGSLSLKDHGILLQEKRLLDFPKLLDVCAIYGHENEDLTRSLILNALKAQPGFHKSFTPMLSHIVGVVHTMYQRCSSSLEAVISAGTLKDAGAGRRRVEFLEVMDFLNDVVVSLDAFVSAYNPAAVFFSTPVEISGGNEELINILARLHDSLIPSLQQGLQIILADDVQKNMPLVADVSTSSKILSSRVVEFGWKLLYYCYLSDEVFRDELLLPAASKMFPANVEDPSIRGDILIQALKEIAEVPQTIHGSRTKLTYLQTIQKSKQITLRVESLHSSGWISMDEEQCQYLAGMLMHPMSQTKSLKESDSVSAPVRSDDPRVDEDAVIMESKISQIRDLFPEYGKGYLSACLQVYNHDPEEVIQSILEGTLHEDLQALDTSLEILPPKPPSSQIRNDKGKGKLLEPPALPSSNTRYGKQSSQPQVLPSSSSTSSSSIGRFVRKGKADEAANQALESRDMKHLERTMELSSQYEYEDEYDDSFDDLGMTVVESGQEEIEILGDRVSSSMGMSSGSESSVSTAGGSKWGSKKKPQFYVKDGKNYSYKVEGSIEVANLNEAKVVIQVQKETIHGLGRGGNLPMGAAKKISEWNKEEEDESEPSEEGGGTVTGSRGRGRGSRGGGRNHHRKDRALRKQMAGFTY